MEPTTRAGGGDGDRETVSISYRPIGVVRSPHAQLAGMPLQTVSARDVAGVVEVADEFAGGLEDVEGFSHLILVTHLHATTGWSPRVVPFLDDRPRGVFACRSPRRPNPIGLSLVRLVRVEGRRLHVLDVDLLDGTPVLDIKPYVPRFDACETARVGWFAGRLERIGEVRSDDRFAGPSPGDDSR